MDVTDRASTMQLSRFYCDVDEKTRRASFLRLVATQAVQLGTSGQQVDFLKSLYGRVMHELNEYSYDNGIDKPLPSPLFVARRIKKCFRDTQEQYPSFDRAEIRHVLEFFVSCFRDFQRAETCEYAGTWQGKPKEVPDPNPVLQRYLAEIEPIVEEIQRAYRHAFSPPDAYATSGFAAAEAEILLSPGTQEIWGAEEDEWDAEEPTEHLHVRRAEEIRVHVNIVLRPKSERAGPVHGSTGTTTPCDIENPKPGAGPMARIVRVEIKLPDQPDAYAAFMLPYTVAHEVGIHSLQQVSGTPALYPDRELWHFSEGFMDAAIVALVRNYLDRPDTDEFRRRWTTSAQWRHRDRVTNDLPTLAYAKKPLWIEQLNEGINAWESLTELARAAYSARRIAESPLDWALSVAFKINVLDLKSDTRARFLHTLLSDWGNRPRDLKHEEILQDPGMDVRIAGQSQQVLFACLNAMRGSGDLADCRDEILSLIARYPASHLHSY